jgi:hypothetical protein
MRIEKHGVLRLLGGPGPKAVALDQVLQYRRVMPPTKTTKRTNLSRVAQSLLSTRTKIARASTPRATGTRPGSTSLGRPRSGSLLTQSEMHARSTRWS